MINYHIIVTGRVQGVGFRWSTHEIAQRYGLVGQVANQWDGSVIIDVQGPLQNVQAFINEVRQGPNPYARIDHFQIQERVPNDEWDDFKMR